jgi:phosphoenolpyruvate carboxylase
MEFVEKIIKHFARAALQLHAKVVDENREFISFFSEASKLVSRTGNCECTPTLSLDEVI